MDNLTHTLIGLIAGESIARSTQAKRPGLADDVRRKLFVALAVIGGNLPDLDLVYSYRAFPRNKLAYLLQHRGYTHTVLGCLVLALLVYAGAEWWMRWKRLAPTGQDRCGLAAMAVFGTLLHLMMDALNSYGVHPFWPARNRWLYGDSVFIIEPLFWMAAAPLFFVAQSALARWFVGSALLAALAVGTVSHLSQPAWYIGFALLTIGLLMVGKRGSARVAARTSAGITVFVAAAFIFAGRTAAHRIEAIAAASFPEDVLIDHVLTPMPTNPLCWDVLLLETQADLYTVRHGVLSDAPMLIAAADCRVTGGDQRPTAPMRRVPAPDSMAMRWLGEFAMSRTLLATLVANHCDAAALMQFARAPFATQIGRRWVMGDLRFDREPQLGIAEIVIGSAPSDRCPTSVPWIPPREDLLERVGRSP